MVEAEFRRIGGERAGATVKVDVLLVLHTATAIPANELIAVSRDDGHRRRFGIDHKQATTAQSHKDAVVLTDKRADRSVVRTVIWPKVQWVLIAYRRCTLARFTAWSCAGEKVQRRFRIVRKGVGRRIIVDALQQLAVLIRDNQRASIRHPEGRVCLSRTTCT